MHQQFNLLKPTGYVIHQQFNLLKPTGYVMHQQFNLLKPTGYVMHQQFRLLKPTGYVMHQQFNISKACDQTVTTTFLSQFWRVKALQASKYKSNFSIPTENRKISFFYVSTEFNYSCNITTNYKYDA